MDTWHPRRAHFQADSDAHSDIKPIHFEAIAPVKVIHACLLRADESSRFGQEGGVLRLSGRGGHKRLDRCGFSHMLSAVTSIEVLICPDKCTNRTYKCTICYPAADLGPPACLHKEGRNSRLRYSTKRSTPRHSLSAEFESLRSGDRRFPGPFRLRNIIRGDAVFAPFGSSTIQNGA